MADDDESTLTFTPTMNWSEEMLAAMTRSFVAIDAGDGTEQAKVRDGDGQVIGLSVELVGEGRFMLPLVPIEDES